MLLHALLFFYFFSHNFEELLLFVYLLELALAMPIFRRPPPPTMAPDRFLYT